MPPAVKVSTGLLSDFSGLTVTASLSGLIALSTVTSSIRGAGSGYLPMTAGQSTTLSDTATASSAVNLVVEIHGFFTPTP